MRKKKREFRIPIFGRFLRKNRNASSSSDSNEETSVPSLLSDPNSSVKRDENSENKPAEPTGCEMCKSTNELRIILRQCGHVICLPCIMDYLKKTIILDGYPRIKCALTDCTAILHPNDINAILDEKEPALEAYMEIEQRRFIQYKQNKHSIYQALPGDQIKRCPICKAVYLHEPGCNYVICANSECSTGFCWECEKPIGRPITHYTTASPCRLGYTDYAHLLGIVQMILDVNVILLWLFIPFVYLISFLYIPLVILIALPLSLVYDAWSSGQGNKDFVNPQEVFMLMVKLVMVFAIGIIVAIPMAVFSIPSGFIIIIIYLALCFIKMIPFGCTGDRVGNVLCLLRWAGRIFKIGPYSTLLVEAGKERNAAIRKADDNSDNFSNAINSGSSTKRSSPNTENTSTDESIAKV